jgi:hypothetical protein
MKITGIEGVLGGLVSPPKQPKPVEPARMSAPRPAEKPVSEPRPNKAPQPQLPANIQVTRTRIGRPKGVKDGQTPPKRKVSVLLNAQVIDEYDRWSWDLHCNIGALIDQALVEYLRRNRSTTKPS